MILARKERKNQEKKEKKEKEKTQSDIERNSNKRFMKQIF